MSCPICGKPGNRKLRPFCSKRCADVDLAKWLDGSYAVPSQNPDDADEVEAAMEAALDPRRSDPGDA
ncbi:DNA gyrase inhibitor YacG [Sulfitobacter sp. D35]|uniref:DNA gyrase inhibitor YacG n=1 Tax=Sulfitobacter sp. D35 TaxID=3083252 RepID=UPI00296F49EB|nr:DNA gyrase inhibitor YacG [Sulfitobacter sp. D35]MDW4499136.1 DNA gyrase inhibitor YacG [Sulfitobacter sp. D35]